jgi:excisionase family DNA binding protein
MLPRQSFTIEEVAEMYGCSPSHIRRMVKRGDIDIVPHMGRRVLISVAELERTFGVAS